MGHAKKDAQAGDKSASTWRQAEGISYFTALETGETDPGLRT